MNEQNNLIVEMYDYVHTILYVSMRSKCNIVEIKELGIGHMKIVMYVNS